MLDAICGAFTEDIFEAATDKITERFKFSLKLVSSAGVVRVSVVVGPSTAASFFKAATSAK